MVPGLLLLERPCDPLPTPAHERLYATLHELAGSWAMVVLLIPDPSHAGMRPALVPRIAG
jgi:hypothetical protein